VSVSRKLTPRVFVSSQVTLDVEFENGEVRTYSVEPLRAALLGHFGEHSLDGTILGLSSLFWTKIGHRFGCHVVSDIACAR
jgi:hypothetical protein